MAASSGERTVDALTSRTLTPEEFDAWVNAPMSAEEAEEIRALVTWFTRRYPTPSERLAAARRSMANVERLAAAGRASAGANPT